MKVRVKTAATQGDRVRSSIVLTMMGEITSEALAVGTHALAHHPAVQLATRLWDADGPVELELGDFDPTTMTDDELGETAQLCAQEIGRRMVDE